MDKPPTFIVFRSDVDAIDAWKELALIIEGPYRVARGLKHTLSVKSQGVHHVVSIEKVALDGANEEGNAVFASLQMRND